MLRPLISVALGALLALSMAEAMALGFGRVSNATVLGQPLSFTVGVRLDGDENLSAECVVAEVFSGENRLATVRVSIEPGSEPAERNLRVTSSATIDEPVISVNLQITCPNRLARKFVAFIDPPVVSLANTTASPGAAGPVSQPRGEPATGPVVTAAEPGTGAVVASKPTRRPRRVARASTAGPGAAAPRAHASASPAHATHPAAQAGKLARAPVPAAGARLKLEAANDEATRERLNLRLTAAVAPSPEVAASGPQAAAAQTDDEAAQRDKERERLLALEQSLTRLRAESQATQASLVQLQSRLREAEAQRYTNPLVLALAVLALALAAVVAVLLWKRGAGRQDRPQWWAAPAGAAESASAAGGDAEWSGPYREPGADRDALSPNEAGGVVETTASPMLLTQVHAPAQAERRAAPPDPQPEAAQEMSVEELIDLEQQAEFFVVLGQDEAAIDLLMGHLRSSGGASPLPYLKLLEIYRRRDELEAYERIRERFNRRFNAYAPDWRADPRAGRTLSDYPNVLARLQALWITPAQTMQAIAASLFRRDAGSSTFDLPAYRELLFLYAVARDLSEHEFRPADVDLLLPIGGEAPESGRVLQLHPVSTASARVERPSEVDVDITRLDAGPARGDERPSRLQTDFSPTSGFADLPAPASRHGS